MEGILEAVFSAMDALLPFAFAEPGFMKRALLALLLIAPAAAAVGVPLVQFRMAFFSDAIGHSAFTGVALGVVLGVSPTWTMAAFGALVAVAIVLVRGGRPFDGHGHRRLFSTVIGPRDRDHQPGKGADAEPAVVPLRRPPRRLRRGDRLDGGAAAARGRLPAACVQPDPSARDPRGVRPDERRPGPGDGGLLRGGDGASRDDGDQDVGILLVTALLVIPAASARNLARGAASAFRSSVAVAVLSGFSGLVASYYLDTATGATVVLSAAACFALTAAAKGLRRNG